MRLPGAIVLAACTFLSGGLARAEAPAGVRLSPLNRQLARVQPTSQTSGVTVSSIQASVDAARSASAQRAAVEARAARVPLNRFVSRAPRPPTSVRPAATLTPASQPATIRR